MNWLEIITRIYLGAFFVISGLNGFFNFYSPPPPNENLKQFIEQLHKSGLLTFVKICEIIFGGALIFNLYVPLSLLILGVIIFIIVFVQNSMNFPKGVSVSLQIVCPYFFLIYIHRESFQWLIY